MLRLKDVILLMATFLSISTGIFLPDIAGYFSGVPTYTLMGFLFITFLPIHMKDLVETWTGQWRSIVTIVILKLVLLPIVGYYLFSSFADGKYATSAILLSGISAGVAATFFAVLLDANKAMVLIVVMISSLLVPFTLPALVLFFLGQHLEISFLAMAKTLALIIFIPLVASELSKRYARYASRKIQENGFFLSIVLIVITNMGVFSGYSTFFHENPSVVLAALGIAMLLSVYYFCAGLLVSWRKPVEYQLTVVICFGMMNNVLVLVFSTEFFSPVEPAVAAMYIIPFFLQLLPLRLYKKWASN